MTPEESKKLCKDTLGKNFKFENDTYFDPEKQIEYEKEKDYEEMEWWFILSLHFT